MLLKSPGSPKFHAVLDLCRREYKMRRQLRRSEQRLARARNRLQVLLLERRRVEMGH